MEVDQDLVVSLLQAVILGFSVSVLLWLLRRYDFVKHMRLSLLGAVISFGVIIVMRGLGTPGDALEFQIFLSLAIFLAASAVLQLIDAIVWDYFLYRRRGVAMPRLVVDIFNVVVLLVMALIILHQVFSVDLNAVLVTSTVASAVIGLALQDTLGNVISGLALQIDRPFDVGHWVNVNGREGEVRQMNWRTITLRSIDNHHIVISNSDAARRDIVNYSWPTLKQRLHVSVGLSYTYPPGDVKRILDKAVRDAEGVLDVPGPDILIQEYGESAIIYDVRYWIDDFAHTPEIQDAVLTRIWYAIRRAGMSVPFPIRDVNLRQIPEDFEIQARERLQQEIYDQLRKLPIFSPLSDDQIRHLANEARAERFTADEYLVRQGEVGDSLFVINNGQTRIDVRDQAGSVMTVAHRGPGDFFGEMSLLTGERRTASVIAEGETEVVIVDKDALAHVLSGDLESLEALSHIVAQRFQELAAKMAEAEERRPVEALVVEEASLLARIQGFLGLR